jgi:hypothetical protein
LDLREELKETKKTAPFLGPQSKEAGWQETQMQGAASAEEAARVEGSRTGKEEDRAHWLRGLFSMNLRNCTCRAKPWYRSWVANKSL